MKLSFPLPWKYLQSSTSPYLNQLHKTLCLDNISNHHPLLLLMVRKLGKWRKFWTRDYTTTMDNTKSNVLASMNQVGSQQSTLIMLQTKSILSTPAIPENLGNGISQELDPGKGATVTTLGARTPAPQSLSFSSLSRYAFPRFFSMFVILSMVRVAT